MRQRRYAKNWCGGHIEGINHSLGNFFLQSAERPMFSLEGKTCVVTGAGKGIGRPMCCAFARQGANVVGAARSEADLDALVAETTAAGGTIAVQRTDVTDASQLERLGTFAVQRFGRIDAWVNNAGGFVPDAEAQKDMIDVAESTIEAMFRLNVTAQILGAQVGARAMRERPSMPPARRRSTA
jgi:NAD(P)-dependent dehydrogenase (short-subunit alcohol dehydrogenase family)